MDCQEIIDRYYPLDTRRREIYIRHATQVADLAVDLARRAGIDLDPERIRTAAMMHDIGIFLTDAPSIDCHGTEPYIRHGILGAQLLRSLGAPEEVARVAERHTGAGITVADIDELNLPLPRHDLMPETQLERLICFADKFYSKSGDMQQKSWDRVIASMKRHSSATLSRFLALASEFPRPADAPAGT